MPRSPVKDVSTLPVVVTLPEIANLYRISTRTIRRALQRNEFRPLPFKKYPYRWMREDIERDLQTRQTKLKTRRHGFAATKGKQLAAEATK